MDSAELKAEALCWLRYVGKKFIVATEVGPFSADVLGIDEKSSIEIETKISKADLNADFSKRKHSQYAAGHRFTPTRFYFMVPKVLGDYAVELVEAQAPKYGVLTLDPDGWGQHGRRLVIKRKAAALSKAKPAPHVVRAVTMRMSSELATLRYQLIGLRQTELERLHLADDTIMEFLKGEVAWDTEPLEPTPFTADELKILANLPPED